MRQYFNISHYSLIYSTIPINNSNEHDNNTHLPFINLSTRIMKNVNDDIHKQNIKHKILFYNNIFIGEQQCH